MPRTTVDSRAGPRTIEEQHRRIFQLVHEFLVALRLRRNDAQLLDILDAIIELVGAHSAAEELHLQDHAPSRLRGHRASHESIMKSLLLARDSLPAWLEASPQVEAEQILDELVIHHLRDDSDFAGERSGGW